MASTRTTPGVYIDEISTLPASIAAVATAIPAFIGYTEKAEKNGEDITLTPTRITSFPEYQQYFGGAEKETGITVTVDDSGSERTVSAAITSPSTFVMSYAMQMYFANGGGPCWIVSIDNVSTGGAWPTASSGDYTAGLDVIKKEDEPTLLVMPDCVLNITTDSTYISTVMNHALTQCSELQDRFTIMDVRDEGDITQDAIDFRDGGTLTADYLKYGATYYPYIETTINYDYSEDQVLISHTPSSATGADDYNGLYLDDVKNGSMTGGQDANLELYSQILTELQKLRVVLPPSSSIAGVYARVDRNRGVWKAPANEGVSNTVGPNIKITHQEQGGLNVDATSGKSINAIRSFTGKGTLVWGSRTLAGNDNEWRYIPVRRLYIFIEESVKKATEFVVFEPNDANTWLRVKTMISNFLTDLWRDGALAGATPADAFFVNVGLGETMTSQDILEGKMIVEIGLAAVRPAEFIILRFSHKLQTS